MKEKYILIAKSILHNYKIKMEEEDLLQEVELCILEMKAKKRTNINSFYQEFFQRLGILLGLNKKDLKFIRINKFLLNDIYSLNSSEILEYFDLSFEDYQYLRKLKQVLTSDFLALSDSYEIECVKLEKINECLDIVYWLKKAKLGKKEKQAVIASIINEENTTKIASDLGLTFDAVKLRIYNGLQTLKKTEPFASEFKRTRKNL